MKLNKTNTVIALAIGLVGSASAANIALTDPSFEGGFTGTNGTTVSGWFSFGGSATANPVGPGTFWGGGGGIANRDGANAIYATSTSTGDGGSIYQTVELDAGITYRFTAGVTQSSSVNKNDANFQLTVFSTDFGTQYVQTNGIAPNQQHSFTDYSVEFTPAASGQYNVGVRNRGHIAGTGANNDESTVFFDNARLEVVPEPSSAALLGLGGLALILRRRK